MHGLARDLATISRQDSGRASALLTTSPTLSRTLRTQLTSTSCPQLALPASLQWCRTAELPSFAIPPSQCPTEIKASFWLAPSPAPAFGSTPAVSGNMSFGRGRPSLL